MYVRNPRSQAPPVRWQDAGLYSVIETKQSVLLEALVELAKEFAESAGLNFEGTVVCFRCHKAEGDGVKLLTCARCSSIHYCSRKCQKEDCALRERARRHQNSFRSP